MKKLRILFLSSVGAVGGAELSLIDLVAALDRKRFEPWALVPRGGELGERLRALGVRVEHCASMSRLYRTRRALRFGMQCARVMRTAATVRRVVLERRIDLVHANTTGAALHALSVPGISRAPTIWHVRDLAVGAEGNWLARMCAGVIAASHACANSLPRAAFRRPMAIVPSGISLDVASPRRAAVVSSPVLVAVAHLAPWKGHGLLIEALRIVRSRGLDASLLLAGGDPFGDHAQLRTELNAQIDAAGLRGAVTWLGSVSDVRELLYRADSLVHAAYPEPFGRTIVEALSCECPVVAFAGEHGPAEILADGVGGLLVAPRSAQAYADAIVRLFTEPGLRDRITRGARSKVENQYERCTVTRLLESFYERVLRSGAGGDA